MAEVITAAATDTPNNRLRTCSRGFPARADQVRRVRAFLRPMLADCPVAGDALLICSELAGNAVQHSASGRPGGHFNVRVAIREGEHVWIEVEDDGGRWAPQGYPGEHGRGLLIVEALAACWDIRGDQSGRVVRARLDWPVSAQGARLKGAT
jgi:serine/threonine-protein kinase RsbW